MFAATLVKTSRAPGFDELIYETIKSLPYEILRASFDQLISLSLSGSHPVQWSIDRLVNMFECSDPINIFNFQEFFLPNTFDWTQK